MKSILQKQLDQIDYDAQKAKEALEAEAYKARQDFAIAETKRVRWEAEELVKQIEYDAKKITLCYFTGTSKLLFKLLGIWLL